MKNLKTIIQYMEIALFVILPFAHTAAIQSLLYLGAFILWIIKMKQEKNFVVDFKDMLTPICLFGGTIILSFFTSLSPSYSISEFKSEYLTQLLLFLTLVNTVDKKNISKFLFCQVLASLVMSVYGILEFYFFLQSPSPFPRANSLANDYNFLSCYLIMVMPFMLYFIFTTKKYTHKILYTLILTLNIWCLLLTYSRGAWVAAILIFTLFALFKEKKLIFVFIILLAIFAAFAPKHMLQRGKSLIEVKEFTKEATISSRLYLWNFGLNEIKKSPFTGNGYGRDTFLKAYPELTEGQTNWHTHNLFIDIALETGIQGILAFLFLMFFIFAKMFLAYKKATAKEEKMIIFTLFLSIIAFLSRCFFDYLLVANIGKLLWMIIGLGALFNGSEKEIN